MTDQKHTGGWKDLFKEALIQILFEFIGTFMITIALANYMTQSSWDECETKKPVTIETYPISNANVTPFIVFNNTIDWIEPVPVPIGNNILPQPAPTPNKFSLFSGLSNLTNTDQRFKTLRQYEGCQNFDQIGLFAVIFCAIMVCQKISGSHFNPMVTVSLMLLPIMEGQIFDFKLGLMYIAAQMVGALFGALLNIPQQITGIDSNPIALELAVLKTEQGKAVFLETSASFILVFMWLSTQNKATRFSEDLAINNAFLAGATLVAMLIGGLEVEKYLITTVNPTIGFAIFFANQTKHSWESSWLFFIVPWLGGFLALTFYYCIYLKAKRSLDQIAVSEDDDEEDEDKNYENQDQMLNINSEQ